MDREKLKRELLTFKDLGERWGYSSPRGARRRAQFDRKFPEPIKTAGNGARIFWLPDIEEYEKLRGKIDVANNRFTYYETLEEYKTKTREEREKQRGYPYRDEEWEKIKQLK